uniref:ELM2 domain-containing protein n=1 Tax=Caenorhabditis tropicalis TaxID=1561998 RepID=A0A1I7U327_9PELO
MDNEDEDIRCQVMWQLNQDKKHEEVVEHLLTGCIQCITNPKKRFNGKEMLFPNGPPPWIKVPESEKSNPEAWKKYQKQRVHVQMTPEEFDDFLVNSDLSDYMMCFEIAKHKRCEKIQAWKEVREVRRKQKAIRLEAEKKEKELKKKNWKRSEKLKNSKKPTKKGRIRIKSSKEMRRNKSFWIRLKRRRSFWRKF